MTDDFFFFTGCAKWKAPRQLIRSLSGVLWRERLFSPISHLSKESTSKEITEVALVSLSAVFEGTWWEDRSGGGKCLR